MESVLTKARDAGILVVDWDTQVDPSLLTHLVYNVIDEEFGAHIYTYIY